MKDQSKEDKPVCIKKKHIEIISKRKTRSHGSNSEFETEKLINLQVLNFETSESKTESEEATIKKKKIEKEK